MRIGKATGLIIITIFFCVVTVFSEAVYAEETIKIGVVAPLTGSWADAGTEMLRGVEVAVDEINSKGGLVGKKIEIVEGDVGAFSGEKIVSVGEKLVHRDKVDFIVTQYLGGVVDVKTFGEFDVPYLNMNTSEATQNLIRENLPKYSNVFQVCGPETAYSSGMFDFGTRIFPKLTDYTYPNKKIALITMVRSYNDRISKRFREIAEDSEWEIVVDEKTPSGTVEWGSVLTKIRQAKPAIIFFNDHVPTDEVAFLEQFHNNPTKSLLLIQYGPSNPAFLKLGKKKTNGIFWGAVYSGWGRKVAGFRDKYKEKYNEEAGFGDAAGTYTNTMIWAGAVRKVGDSKNYEEVCRMIREYIWNFTGDNHVFNPINQTVIMGEGLEPFKVYQVQNQQHKLISPSAFADAKVVVPAWME